MNLLIQDDDFYYYPEKSSNSNNEQYIVNEMNEQYIVDEIFEPLITPTIHKDLDHGSLVFEECCDEQASTSNNFAIHIHSLYIQNETRMTKELRLVQDIVHLYNKYKKQRYALDHQHFIEKVLMLLRHSEVDKPSSVTLFEDEILHLISVILDHETDLMCMKMDLIGKWKEIECCRTINTSKAPSINIFFKLNVCESDKSDCPLYILLQQLQSVPTPPKMDLFSQSLSLLINSDLFQYEPLLFRSSVKHDLNKIEVNQIRSLTIGKSDRFFVKLLVNGTLAYTTPLGIYDPSKGSIRFDVQFSTIVSSLHPDICVQVYKTSHLSPSYMLCSLYIMYPQHSLDRSPPMGEVSSHLLPPVSLWYHFSSTNHINGACVRGSLFSGYIGVTTYFLASVNCQTTYHANFMGQARCKSAEIMNQQQSLKSMSFKPDPSLSFKDLKTGRLFEEFLAMAEPKRLSFLRIRSSNLSNLLIMSDAYNSMTGTSRSSRDLYGTCIDWKVVFESVIRQRPLLEREKVESIISLLSSVENQNMNKEDEIQQCSDVVFDIGESRTSDNFLSLQVFQKIFCPSARRLLWQMHNSAALSRTDIGSPTLIITIIAARNIPSRSSNKINIQQPSLRSPSSHMDTLFSYNDGVDPGLSCQENECVNPFFQVKFHGKKYFSKVISRKSPYFKQTLRIPLLLGDESCFTPKTLKGSDDSIEITLFDAYELGSYDACDHHFIGGCMIPLKLLYTKSQVGGIFKLAMPEFLVGYERSHGFMGNDDIDAPESLRVPNRLPEESSITEISDSYENIDMNTYIDIAVNIQPNFSQSIIKYEDENFDNLSHHEDVSLLETLKKWIHDCKLENTRWIRLAATDLKGNQWVITRYIKRLSPPHSVRKSMRHCSHFVSLISLRSSITVLRSYSGRISSTQQTIDLQSGDELEHTILLANFFLYLSKKRRDRFDCHIFMVFGRGHCEEQIALVGTAMKDKRFLLWDASKGDVYSVKHATWYPIVEVSNLVTSSHIYLNLQRNLSVNELSFDIHNTKKWSCFPSQADKSFLPSIQSSSIDFHPPNYKLGAQLESEIGKSLRESLSAWRGSKCNFRDDVSDRLTGILEELEDIKLNGRDPKIGYFTSISSLTKNREMFGFPLHFPFTNVRDIVDHVEKTEIHTSMHPQVEFAISVRVFPYESKVLSVWVFICSLSPLLNSTTIEKEGFNNYKKLK